jgi:hypothetical protein
VVCVSASRADRTAAACTQIPISATCCDSTSRSGTMYPRRFDPSENHSIVRRGSRYFALALVDRPEPIKAPHFGEFFSLVLCVHYRTHRGTYRLTPYSASSSIVSDGCAPAEASEAAQ